MKTKRKNFSKFAVILLIFVGIIFSIYNVPLIKEKIEPLALQFEKILIPEISEKQNQNSGKIETNLYLNEKNFEQFKDENVKISIDEFKTYQFRLNIKNNSNKILTKLNIEEFFKINQGGSYHLTGRQVPLLNIGESTDILISLKPYQSVFQKVFKEGEWNIIKPSTAYLEIYIHSDDYDDEKLFTKNYWHCDIDFAD